MEAQIVFITATKEKVIPSNTVIFKLSKTPAPTFGIRYLIIQLVCVGEVNAPEYPVNLPVNLIDIDETKCDGQMFLHYLQKHQSHFPQTKLIGRVRFADNTSNTKVVIKNISKKIRPLKQ